MFKHSASKVYWILLVLTLKISGASSPVQSIFNSIWQRLVFQVVLCKVLGELGAAVDARQRRAPVVEGVRKVYLHSGVWR